MLHRIALAALLVAAASAYAHARDVTLGAATNLRKAPGTNAEVVGLMPKGEKIEVGECDAGWCKVTWNGNEGFAIGRNLGLAAPRAPARRVARTSAPMTPEEADAAGYVPVPPPEVYDDGPVYGPPPPYGYYYGPRPYRYWRPGYSYHRRYWW